MVSISKPKAIILDIEGTTTSLQYWPKTLSPFIRQYANEFLQENWKQKELMLTIEKMRELDKKEEDRDCPEIESSKRSKREIIDSVIQQLIYRLDNKKPNQATKELQILIWLFGYEKKLLKGHIYKDVPRNLHKWKHGEIKVYLLSSGAAVVQKMIFAFSQFGNLLPLIENVFSGSKTDSKTFRKIADNEKFRVERILFLTDTPEEAAAATKAGCRAVLLYRPENKPIDERSRQTFSVIDTFDDLIFE